MLSKLLSKKECAECKLCCNFDDTDLWEIPIITNTNAQYIIENFPSNQKIVKDGENYLPCLNKNEDGDLYYCSLLNSSSGCIMGENKPFDCKIWPFRIMNFNGNRVITLSPVCPVVKTRSLEQIYDVAKQIAPEIFSYADKNPQAIKPYIPGYPIIVTEN